MLFGTKATSFRIQLQPLAAEKKSISRSSVANRRKSEPLTPDEHSLVSVYPIRGSPRTSEINLTKPDKTKYKVLLNLDFV